MFSYLFGQKYKSEYNTGTSVIHKSHPDSLGFNECDNLVYENFIQHPLPHASIPPSIVFIKNENNEKPLSHIDRVKMKFGKFPDDMDKQESRLYCQKENVLAEIRKANGSFLNIKKNKIWNHVESLRNRIDEINTDFYNGDFSKDEYNEFLEWSAYLEKIVLSFNSKK
jgi:hypothetical protein